MEKSNITEGRITTAPLKAASSESTLSILTSTKSEFFPNLATIAAPFSLPFRVISSISPLKCKETQISLSNKNPL